MAGNENPTNLGPVYVEETPETRQNLPLDGVTPVWEHRTTMRGTEKQFSITRAALNTCGGAKNQFLISDRGRRAESALISDYSTAGRSVSVSHMIFSHS